MQALLRIVLAFCMGAWTGLAHGAALQISPVLVDMAPQQAASGIMLRNPGNTPIYGQVRIYRWDQEGGDDVLTATEEVQASPPIIQVAPGGEQLVRLVRASREVGPTERSYRLIIDEIPDPATPGISGVVLRLRYSVPVFVAGAAPSPAPDLAWQVQQAGDSWVLRLSNTGTRYAQVAAVQILNAAGKPVANVDGLLGYALAQRAREWRIPAKQKAPGSVRIKALINGDVVTVSPRID
ncbi:fimbrial biogenesis chaperone [Achromobacter pestifer]